MNSGAMDQIDKQLIETLKSLRNDSDFGASLDFDGIHRRAMLRNGFDPEATKTVYSWRDYLETYMWVFTHSMLKPMVAAAAVFIFTVAGSISLAGAAGRALPGEQLYSMKIGIEKAQLALAIDDQARAQLRVEFAGRRLEEMVVLAAQIEVESQTVQIAANRFKTEVANIQEELSTGASAPSGSQTEFAKSVGRKVEVYSSTVASSGNDLPETVLGEVEEILEETKEQVVEVIITAHESEQDEDNAHELDVALDAEIEKVVSAYGDLSMEAVATAEALRAEGLYRRAFQVLKDFIFEAGLVPQE
jgi:hypothetical protein